MPHPHPHSHEIRSLDTEVGDDGDMPGIAQELTADDIDDIAYSPELPVEERLQRLLSLRDELRTRASGDMMGDMNEMLNLVKDRITVLRSNAIEGDAALESTGMDSSYRRDDDDPADDDPEDED
jgi:hypothetical protein